MARKDAVMTEINEFLDDIHREWTVKRANGGYAFFNESGWPVVRIGRNREYGFDVQHWGRSGRWKTMPLARLGGMPLDDALRMIR